MDNYLLYSLTVLLFILSFYKDKTKTKKALKKAWKSFEGILPQLLTINLFVGIIISALNPQLISQLIGAKSGWLGVILSAVIGSISLIPGFVAFPMAATLLQNGAGYMQIGAFISTLMMVGIITLPVEIQYFGKKLSFLRNSFAFLFSFLVAFVLSKVVG
ncbi:permease [Tepidibacillus sp. HK-1]|uniref:permease n=1 Tax=Tepidibacillus sp. HK-1 TaxID=1883407 RepID=UPI0008536B72|nr:permease [Tepidibacillus sp. HK-1]GBF10475.1 putative permease [Tepidibacillus sp. HK-1]